LKSKKDRELPINSTKANQPPPRHIIIKYTKYTDKEGILKAAREKSP